MSKTKGFLETVIKNLTKSKEEVQKDQLSDRLDDFVIECNTQITVIKTRDIPTLEADKTRTERSIAKAKTAVEDAKYDIVNYTKFTGYINNLYNKETELYNLKTRLEQFKTEIETKEAEVTKYEGILETFKA